MQLHKVSLLSLMVSILAANGVMAATGSTSGGGSKRKLVSTVSLGDYKNSPISKDSPLRRVLYAVLEKKTPQFEDMQILGTLTTEGRRRAMRAFLNGIAKNRILTNSEIHLAPGKGPLGMELESNENEDEKINELLAHHGLPPYTPEFPDHMYQSLNCALGMMGAADFVEPKYVMATQEELRVPATLAAADAYFIAHPDATLILRAEESDAPLSLALLNIPESLRHLSIVGDHVTDIGHMFLSGCTKLTTLDLSSLRNVTTIGINFLSNCKSLTTVNMNFKNVTTIDIKFMDRCRSLDAATQKAVADLKAAVVARGGTVGR